MQLPLPQGEVAIVFRGSRQPEILLSLHVQDGGPAEQPKLQKQTAVQFGETILHLAFIKGQNDIAKKLLEHFPKMVNDVYIGSEYYGDFYILKCSTFVNYWSELTFSFKSKHK